MIRAILAVVAATAFVAATVSVSTSQSGWIDTGLDLDPAGNEARILGPIDSCVSVQPGATFQIDVWVKGIPPATEPGNYPGGIAGIAFNLLFDPAILQITGVDNNFMIFADGGDVPFEWIDADATGGAEQDPWPATTGDARIESIGLGRNRESGDGVTNRLTLKAIGTGTSTLTLRDDLYDNYPAPTVLQGNGNLHFINSVQNGLVVVGQSCDQRPAPTPVNIGGLGGTIPGGATFPPTSPGDTGGSASGRPTGSGQTAAPGDESPSPDAGDGPSVAIDAVPAGNEAAVLGEIETCAAANKGDRFIVDLVIQDVNELLAWEADIQYDGDVLDVVASDTKLFLANGEDSQVNDTSAHTPDDSGHYVAGAVDLADPAEPDSGSGVLVRLTMEAKADGTSKLSLEQADSNGDGKMDDGVFLRDVDANIIGDTNGDAFFDGPAGGAEIRVGEDCPGSDAQVMAATDATGGAEEGDDDGGGVPVAAIAGAVALAAAAAGGAAYYVLRVRRRGGPGDDGDAPV